MRLLNIGWLDNGKTRSPSGKRIPNITFFEKVEITGIKDLRVRGKFVFNWDRYVRNWQPKTPLRDTTGLAFRLRYPGKGDDWERKYFNINWNTDGWNGRKP